MLTQIARSSIASTASDVCKLATGAMVGRTHAGGASRVAPSRDQPGKAASQRADNPRKTATVRKFCKGDEVARRVVGAM